MAGQADNAFRVLTAQLAADLRALTELRAHPMQSLHEKLGNIPGVLRHAHETGGATVARQSSLYLDTGRSADFVQGRPAVRTGPISFSNASSEEAHAYGVRVWGKPFPS